MFFFLFFCRVFFTHAFVYMSFQTAGRQIRQKRTAPKDLASSSSGSGVLATPEEADELVAREVEVSRALP